MKAARALLILETQSKDAEGNSIYSASTPEVVLPTYMAAAFGLETGGSITEIIGVDGNDKINALNYFKNNANIGARFITLTATNDHYYDRIKRIYSRKMVFESNTPDAEVLT